MKSRKTARKGAAHFFEHSRHGNGRVKPDVQQDGTLGTKLQKSDPRHLSSMNGMLT